MDTRRCQALCLPNQIPAPRIGGGMIRITIMKKIVASLCPVLLMCLMATSNAVAGSTREDL